MLSRYSIPCPYENCDWIGNLIPSFIEGSNAMEIAAPQKAWFECPSCARTLEVQISDGVAKVLPISKGPLENWRKDETAPLPSKMESSGDVRIITFAAGRKRCMEEVIATEIDHMDGGESECHLLLDFTNVTSITSVELGTLIGLHKKMRASGGRLTLFNLNLNVFEVFSITRLEKLLEICR